MSLFTELAVRLPDGYEAYARYWPAETPRGAVLYHHGIQSHSGWYHASAALVRDAGYSVLQVDRRGSGCNSQARGHADSAEQLISDAEAAGDELKRRSGFERCHVVGVSWGGKLAVAAHAAHPERALSLTLVTPGLFPIIGVSKTTMAQIGFAMLYEPKLLFDIPLNDPVMFTKVERWQAFFRDDELTLRQCTAGFYLASRRMDRIVNRLRDSRPVPVHLFLAGEERIVDNDATEEFVRGLGWPGTQITTYATARHSLEFDVPEAYFKALIGFISELT